MIFLNNKITIRQLQILLLIDIFGTGILALPRRAAVAAGRDGFLVIILATIVVSVFGLIITSIGRMFSNDDFVTYSSKILSPPIGVIISFLFVIKLVINGAMEIRLFGEMVKQTMLLNTPFWIICLSLLILSAYAASKGYESRARIAEIVVYLVIIPILIVYVVGCFGIKQQNIIPIMSATPKELLNGTFSCLVAFSGLELILLVFPFVEKSKRVKHGVMEIIFTLGIIMMLITFVTIGRFGVQEVSRKLWPVIDMMDVTELPGSFIERQEALMISFLIISVFAFLSAMLFFSSLLLKSIIKKGTHSTYIIFCAIVIFLISFVPKNVNEVYAFMDFVFMTFGSFFLFILPVILLVVAKMRGFGKETSKNSISKGVGAGK